MQRKTPKFPKEQDMKLNLSPFTMSPSSFPSEGFATVGSMSNGIEAARAAFPLFGGAEDDDTETSPADSDKSPATTSSDTTSSAGGEPNLKEAEVPNLEAMTPEKIAELLKNVTDLSTKVTQLTAENNTYKTKEQTAERAKQTREQQLEQDLVDTQKIVAKMDAVIRHTAIVNAIQGAKDIEFHNARHVMSELADTAFDVDVDLESGSATVTGIDGELKRIAKEFPWLVSKDKTHAPANQTQQRVTRGSGTPPGGAGDNNKKLTTRSEMINKFPVIAHGRAG